MQRVLRLFEPSLPGRWVVLILVVLLTAMRAAAGRGRAALGPSTAAGQEPATAAGLSATEGHGEVRRGCRSFREPPSFYMLSHDHYIVLDVIMR